MMRNVRLKGVRKHNGDEYDSKGKIPELLDEATFNAVQDALDRLGNGKGKKKSVYELSGLMQCGRCRTTLQAMHNENWYRCPSSSMQSTRGQCGKLKVTGGIAKTAVRDYVVDRLQDGWIDDILKANEAMADEGKVSEAKQELETAQLRKARLKRDYLNGV